MSMSALIALAAIAAIILVSYREHRGVLAARRCLLNGCVGVLDKAQLTHGGDGFPRLAGQYEGRAVRVELIPDTMTIRRLPQLWLSVSLLDRNPGVAGFSVLVRPTGNEFYSLNPRFAHRHEPPPGFPAEVLIRGDRGAGRLLAELSKPLGTILADPRVKEVAVTERGLRIVRQAGEGKRGEHLLLRQALFENANVTHTHLESVLHHLETLRAIVDTHARARAA